MSTLTAVPLVIAGIATKPGPAAVKMDLLNAHSVVNKGSLVQDIIVSQNLDVLAVTETWIICDDSDAVKLILVSSLTMHFIFGVFLQCKSDILYEHADI